MLCTKKVVIKTIGFFTREREHLLRTRGEVAHGFFAHTCIYNATSFCICPLTLKLLPRFSCQIIQAYSDEDFCPIKGLKTLIFTTQIYLLTHWKPFWKDWSY